MGIIAKTEDTGLLDAISELARYRGQDPRATAFNVGNSFYLVNEVWRASNPKTSAEIMAHYRTCEMQVEQQVFATYGIPHEVALRERIMERTWVGESVLDFGAGIGSQLLPLVALGRPCTHVDVGGVMMDYAAWRYSRANPRVVELITLRDDYMEAGVRELAAKKFDVVICTEVIEHVPDPEKFVAMLSGYVKSGGLLVATTSFHDDGTIPMHLNVDKYTDEGFAGDVFPLHGLTAVENSIYRKA
jgi:2-polyprenyl-3-methyl-5-hydroxy-6-metoxy-1,4-benzoquinol methylase